MKLSELMMSLAGYNNSWQVKIKISSLDPKKDFESPVPICADFEISNILINASCKTIYLYCKVPSVK